MNERIPDQDELNDLGQLSNDGIECLTALVDLPADRDSAAVVRAVRQFVDEVRQGTPLPSGHRDLEQVAYKLGTLWGDQLCHAAEWEWVHLQEDDGIEGWAVASPDRSHACFAHHFLFGKLAEPENDNTVALLFNMISEGRVPPSSPGSYNQLR